MDYRLTDEDKERIKLLEEVSKKQVKNLSLEPVSYTHLTLPTSDLV